ncbi:MAG: hypothetical protein GY820_25235, partial [Gammaproteobacteria bacterium]|nr:hypothetical protein [Gammaproteobacteria bacterium]
LFATEAADSWRADHRREAQSPVAPAAIVEKYLWQMGTQPTPGSHLWRKPPNQGQSLPGKFG